MAGLPHASLTLFAPDRSIVNQCFYRQHPSREVAVGDRQISSLLQRRCAGDCTPSYNLKLLSGLLYVETMMFEQRAGQRLARRHMYECPKMVRAVVSQAELGMYHVTAILPARVNATAQPLSPFHHDVWRYRLGWRGLMCVSPSTGEQARGRFGAVPMKREKQNWEGSIV